MNQATLKVCIKATQSPQIKWNAQYCADNAGWKFRTAYYTGKGRYSKLVDYTARISAALTEAGIAHTVKNDAPRGGDIGNYIEFN